MTKLKKHLLVLYQSKQHPIVNKIADCFEQLTQVNVETSDLSKYWYLIKSFRPNKKQWYQRWIHYREHTPKQFKRLTRRSENIIDQHADCDVVIHHGTLFSIGRYTPVKKYFIITDSTRKLSHLNPHERYTYFDNSRQEREWFQIEGDVYRNATGLIARSTRVADSFVNDYGVDPDKILVKVFGTGDAPSNGVENKVYDGKTILYVGKGDFEAKGGYVVLDAFKWITKEIPQARLIIVGQPDLKNLPAGVESLGVVKERQRLRKLFEAAHIFLLPSYVDRFGMTLLEAMAANTPCIGADYGAMPEIIDNTGFIINPGDSRELANKCIQLLSDKRLSAELGEKARRRYVEELSWDAVKKDVMSFIEKKLV